MKSDGVFDIQLPPKLIPVFGTNGLRYRGAYGGRGSAKTRSFAKMAAVRAMMFAQAGVSGVIVCGREFMNSLDESSMAEVKEAIESESWLSSFFEIGEKFIRTRSGLPGRIDFKFVGLRRNLDSIKSKARILIFWVDEAEPVSENAWKKLIPTVREDESEIWVTWNPEREDSATDKRFRKNPPSNSAIVEMNWQDNPWFPDVLRQEMERDLERDPAMYEHVWGGGYNKRSDAQVFTNWTIDEFEAPEDVTLRFGADWGFAVDPTVLIRLFADESKRRLYIDHEAYAVGCAIDDTPALFAGDCPWPDDPDMRWSNPFKRPGIPGATRWPITADNARPETIQYMRKRGFNIKPARKGAGSVEDGVEFLKSFDIIVHPRCKHTINELRFYRYKVDRQTDEVLPILEDKDNHVIDALRYALEGYRRAPKPVTLAIAGERLSLGAK